MMEDAVIAIRLPSPQRRRQLRKAAGISSEQLAEVLGCTGAAVRHWEAGIRRPRKSGQLRAYAEVLSDFEHLLRLHGPQELSEQLCEMCCKPIRDAAKVSDMPPSAARKGPKRNRPQG